MSRINPEVLRKERNRKGWSLEDLERRSGIDRQSIHRIERGGQRRNRRDVITNLARALGIAEDALTSAAAPSPPELVVNEGDELFSQSQLNVRVSDRARNALSLTTLRYGLTLAQIVEVAPLLFCWAAEKSLKRRREQLAEIETRYAELRNLKASHLNLLAFTNWRGEETLAAESRSVEKNDLFGRLVGCNQFDSDLSDDYFEATDNPFAVFLRDLTRELEGLVSFEEWEPDFSPQYAVCKSAAADLVAGDEEAVKDIIEGYVALYQLPKTLREKGMGEARAKWVREEASARRQKISQHFKLDDLGI